MSRPNLLILSLAILSALLTSPILSGKDALADLAGAAKVYYPLDEGSFWDYEIVVTEFGRSRDPSFERIRNLAQVRVNGEEVTPRKAESPGGMTFLVAAREDGVCLVGGQPANQDEPTLLDEPDYFIKEPIEVGATWTYEGITMTIEATGVSVTVPAGAFDGCLKIKRAGTIEGQYMGPRATVIESEGYEWYAPGVGLIKSEGNRRYPTMDHEETVTWRLQSFGK